MSSPLDLDQATMQRLGRTVADHVAAHLAGLRQQRLFKSISRAEAAALIPSAPPASGRDFADLMGFLTERVFAHHTPEPHPGFLAYVQCCPTFPAVLGDWLATGYNFFGGAWKVASGPAMLEVTVLEWFRQWIGMPAGTGGLLTSGGSTANLMALVAARHRAVGDDPSRLARLVVYSSTQGHSSVTRAAWIAGILRSQVRAIAVDDQFRLRPDLLRQQIQVDRDAGLLPLAVVASAGTTNTGATDPLPALAALCQAEQLWFHIDAAYGGFAALAPEGLAALEGLGLADSVTLDPHKWLYVPFECGSLLVRDPRHLFEAFHILPDYMRDLSGSSGEINFADYGEQLSRYSRALKVWLSVSYFGVDALREAIAASLERALLVERLVREQPDLELLSAARLGICCFRVRPSGTADPARLDQLNQRVLEHINGTGNFFLSTTRIADALALRVCSCGWRTIDDDIRRLVAEVAAAGAA